MYRHDRVLLFTGLSYLGQGFNDGPLLGLDVLFGHFHVSLVWDVWASAWSARSPLIQGNPLVFKHIPFQLQVQTVIRWWSIFFDSKYVLISRIITLLVQGTFSGTLALAEALLTYPYAPPPSRPRSFSCIEPGSGQSQTCTWAARAGAASRPANRSCNWWFHCSYWDRTRPLCQSTGHWKQSLLKPEYVHGCGRTERKACFHILEECK